MRAALPEDHEEEAEPLLVDLIGLEHELPDVGVEGVRGDQVEEHLPAPVAAQELSQHQLVAAEECPPRLEHILGGIFAGLVTTSPLNHIKYFLPHIAWK